MPPIKRRSRRRHAAHDRRPAVRRGRAGARGRSKIDIESDAGAGPLVIHGTVNGPDGKPVAGAVVECWHANSKGFYSHFDPTGAQPTSTCAARSHRRRRQIRIPHAHAGRLRLPAAGRDAATARRLGRHGNRPAHVHFFVTSEGHRKLTTQFNIEGDPLIWDDFAYATREELIPHVVDKTGGAALGLKADVQGYRVRLFPDHAGAGQRQPDRQSPAREPPG
jgi:catechol 1,2-dioxygenase